MRRQREECLALLERLNQGEGALCQLRMSVNALGRIDLQAERAIIGKRLAEMGERPAPQRAKRERGRRGNPPASILFGFCG